MQRMVAYSVAIMIVSMPMDARDLISEEPGIEMDRLHRVVCG